MRGWIDQSPRLSKEGTQTLRALLIEHLATAAARSGKEATYANPGGVLLSGEHEEGRTARLAGEAKGVL